METHINVVWKPVKGYESKYSVSTEGEVVNHITNVSISKVIAGTKGSNDYWYVNLKVEGKKRRLIKVSRIVAETFLPNPTHLPHVDHRDRNRFDDRVYNLRWKTHRDNANNRSVTTFVDRDDGSSIPISEAIEQDLGKSPALLTYIHSRIRRGRTYSQAVKDYSWYKKYGVDWCLMIDGMYLAEFVELHNLDFETTLRRRSKFTPSEIISGWIDRTYDGSVEIDKDGAVNEWYRDIYHLRNTNNLTTAQYQKGIENGWNLDQMKSLSYYSWELDGVWCTTKGHMDRYGVSKGTLGSRMKKQGMTLIEAITTKEMIRIRHVAYMGQTWGVKSLLEHLGLNAKTVNKYKSKNNVSIKEAVVRFLPEFNEDIIPILKH